MRALTTLACGLLLGCAAARPQSPPIERWTLSTGSRIAIVRFRATSPTPAPPVIFLHGGPGAYQLSNLADAREWYARLAARRDVVAYDQVGSGLSGKLADPRQYTVARHVADLEAIRARLGAEHIVLAGDSWGATLGAHYIAAHPERVERAIFTSPGSIDLTDPRERAAAVRILPGIAAWAREHRGKSLYRRLSRLDTLLARGSPAAFTAVTEPELDRLLDAYTTDAILPTTVHERAHVGGERMQGMGWWSLTMTNRSRAASTPEARPALRRFERPVLVMRGVSDYLQPEIAAEYVSVFPRARFVSVPDCGHLIWLEQPATYAREIEAFLEAG